MRTLSRWGLVVGTLGFVASLTPSLIPRTVPMQGLLSGLCLAAGYGVGVALRALWVYLELPMRKRIDTPRAQRTFFGVLAFVVFLALLRAPHWQNLVRRAMQQPDVEGGAVLGIAAIAALVFVLVLIAARLFMVLMRKLSRRMERRVPPRVARAFGLVGALVLVALIANGVVFRTALHMLDASFREADARIAPDTAPPTAPESTGSAASLVAWDALGSAGRGFVASAPTAARIARFTSQPTMTPLRVYAGLPAADTAQARAQLALRELERVGGFSRAALIILTPTGSGWIDPAAIDSVEYLYRGNVASVAVQYSYFSSPLSLLIEPDNGEETARALFRAVYGHWRALPKDRRPKLYLHGLSLGAFNSARSADTFEMLGDPVDGALWSGPPFASRQWRALTDARNPGTPEWLPEFRDGAFVRFRNQHGTPVPAGTPWGPMRVVFLQYASDAITFFDQRDAFREPAWMDTPRGPDVSPGMRWYPLVTSMQLALDMMLSDSAPMGYGHVYAPSHYVDAWLDVTGLDDWSPAEVDTLKRVLDAQRRASLAKDEGSG
ncbi:alpha/beta-hydrolase family protein [Lysobacter sp. A6]|uniref:Alpha/beta-hydrolase family protein n=1 Tax=Noviluteimonas lactosilytica TaxID=2888523 RepID=A0ABS8JJY0_9GAMM|nr:alpha/beta-hydrolase family protein [Lysobacter lactosilyticus]MCC8363862.1 alpha/beta-hydrolase family protein [Lysobacter lactosilyticus]